MEQYNLCIQVIAMPCNTNSNVDIFVNGFSRKCEYN